MSSTLPMHWEARVDPSSGYTYYFNTQTGVSQWEAPQQTAQPQPTQQPQQTQQTQSKQSYGSQGGFGGYGVTAQAQTPAGGATETADQLQDGWEERMDTTSGFPYYFNPVTGVSQWDKPLKPKTTSTLNTMNSASKPAQPQPQSQPQPQQSTPQDDLLPGWTEAVDPSSGKTYYVNAQGISQWDKPKAATTASPAAKKAPTNVLDPYTPEPSEAMKKLFEEKELARQNGNFDDSSRTFKFVVVGAGAVGKSALVVRFIKNDFVTDYDPTIEDSYRRQFTVDSIEGMLDILDTAGQEEYSALRANYMRTGDGFLTVFAVNSRMTFVEIPGFIQQIIQVKDKSEVPIVVVGSKCDLNATVAMKSVKELCDTYHSPFIPCSALGNINVETVFTELVRLCRKMGTEEKKKKQKCSLL